MSCVSVCTHNGVLNNIPFLFSPVTCVHDEPENTPNTAPPLPCETHPAQRLFITSVRLIEGFWTRGRRQENIVFVLFVIWDSWNRRAEL